VEAPMARKVESVETIWKREIGERLRLLAKAVGVKHDHEIAEAIGVGRTNWGNWRRGEILLPPAVARQLKERYGCAFDWLYLGERSNNTSQFNERLDAVIRAEGPRNITQRRANG
jgi:transcriptional regulator with XRE-family HTH domain